MKRRVIKKKVNQWGLRQRLKDNPQAQEAMARGAELHLHLLYLQMQSRSSLRGLMGSEMSRMSNLIGWLLSKIRRTYFQQSLILSPPTNNPLAIPVKKGEIFGRVALEEECHFEGEHAKNIISVVFTLCYLCVLVLCFGVSVMFWIIFYFMGLLHTMLNTLVNFLV